METFHSSIILQKKKKKTCSNTLSVWVEIKQELVKKDLIGNMKDRDLDQDFMKKGPTRTPLRFATSVLAISDPMRNYDPKPTAKSEFRCALEI